MLGGHGTIEAILSECDEIQYYFFYMNVSQVVCDMIASCSCTLLFAVSIKNVFVDFL